MRTCGGWTNGRTWGGRRSRSVFVVIMTNEGNGMITLKDGFELDDYWSEVRQTGDERLEESGFVDWVVIVRPQAAEAVEISVATRVLDIGVDGQPDLPPEVFVQTSIIDAIDQAVEAAMGQDHSEDLIRDDGGEA